MGRWEERIILHLNIQISQEKSKLRLTLLIWGVDVISISDHGPDGLSQTVSVRFLSALIK